MPIEPAGTGGRTNNNLGLKAVWGILFRARVNHPDVIIQTLLSANLSPVQMVYLLTKISGKSGPISTILFDRLPGVVEALIKAKQSSQQILDILGNILNRKGIEALNIFDALPKALEGGSTVAQIIEFCNHGQYFPLPIELTSLREPKRPIPGLSKSVEDIFYAGGSVKKEDMFFNRYRLIELISGADTMYVHESDEATYNLYLKWAEKEGIRPIPFEEASSHLAAIAARLEAAGTTFCCRNMTDIKVGSENYLNLIHYDEAWRLIRYVLDALPNSFLGRGLIQRIWFDSERQEMRGAAMLSAFKEETKTVYIYSGLMRGSRRELIGLLLHELGHSTIYGLSTEMIKDLESAFDKIINSLIGLDYAGGIECRKECIRNFYEFMAEMHVIYVCTGPLLRARINNSTEGKAWEFIHNFFRDHVFDRREYE